MTQKEKIKELEMRITVLEASQFNYYPAYPTYPMYPPYPYGTIVAQADSSSGYTNKFYCYNGKLISN